MRSVDDKLYFIIVTQVCDVLWSTHYKELISSHGYAHNQLTVWSYPSLQWMQDLTGHTGRVSGDVYAVTYPEFLQGGRRRVKFSTKKKLCFVI